MELAELKVIVTGAAKGMGAHFATRFAEAGASVAAVDVDTVGLDRLPAQIVRLPGNVAREQDCVAIVNEAHARMGGLNALVNNAGILRDGLLVRRSKTSGEIQTLSLADWQAVIDVNLTGATLMAREFVRKVLETQTRPASGCEGVIVNMASISRHGNRGQSNYVASKAALAANTVTWAREFAQFGIRVGGIAPGMIETPMTADMNQKARDALVQAVPLGRIGTPEDIWRAVRFVIECDYFTGETIDVHGGLTM